MRQVLDWYKRLSKTMPDSVYAYDNASNNKELVSGKAALIMNPPSAYAVAARDKPEIAKQSGPSPRPRAQGQVRPASYYYWGIWNFSKSIPRQKACWPTWPARESRKSCAMQAPASTSRLSTASWISRSGKRRAPKYTVTTSRRGGM
jgi:hypothetical protein